jgi:hypothetical protein
LSMVAVQMGVAVVEGWRWRRKGCSFVFMGTIFEREPRANARFIQR